MRIQAIKVRIRDDICGARQATDKRELAADFENDVLHQRVWQSRSNDHEAVPSSYSINSHCCVNEQRRDAGAGELYDERRVLLLFCW